jgi:phosphoribosylformylglycinamidine cyclo-ligase
VIDDPMGPAPIFNKIQELGNVAEKEMYQTFNMSMGFMIVAPAGEAEQIVSENLNAKVVGSVEEGSGVLLEPGNIIYDHY